jgi:hypothetical protein
LCHFISHIQFVEDDKADCLAQLLKRLVNVRGSDRAHFPALGNNAAYFKKADAEPVFACESALLDIAEIFECRDKTMERAFRQRQPHGDFIQSQLPARFG